MTVNFRRWVAAVALSLLITAGNPVTAFANDGLKTNRYRNTISYSSITDISSRSGLASQINPLRPVELQGTIESLENRTPATNIASTSQNVLRAIHSTDALALLAPSKIGSVSTMTLKAEQRSIANNQVRILADRQSMSMAIVRQTLDYTTRIQKATTSFFEACSVQDLEIERRLAVPASLAVQKQSVPAVSASYSRPAIIPKKPVKPRTLLKSPKGSNYRVLLIETSDAELTPSTKIFERGFPGYFWLAEDGCEFFGECNNCQLSGSQKTTALKNEERTIVHRPLTSLLSPQCHLSFALEQLRQIGREVELANEAKSAADRSPKIILASSKSRTISRSATESMFSALGAMAQTAKHFVDPLWNYVQTFDLLKRIQSIPPWVFSAMLPEYLGRSVSPYGILF